MGEHGIPAAVVSKFLWERGLVVEKTGLYSFPVLFSMGITKGKWSTLLTELLEFKRHYDGNTPLSLCLPSVMAVAPSRYQGLGLRDLCEQLHDCYRTNATAKQLKRLFTRLPEMAMSPAQAYDQLVRAEVEAVPIEALLGRVSAVMLVPYPPGIPLIMPGSALPTPRGQSSTIWPSPGPSTAVFRVLSPMSMACNAKTLARAPSIRSTASRNADEFNAAAGQFEAVFAQVIDPVADGQSVGDDGGAEGAAVGLERRLGTRARDRCGLRRHERGIGRPDCCHLRENL